MNPDNPNFRTADAWELRYYECREENAAHFRKINELQRENEMLKSSLKIATGAIEFYAYGWSEDMTTRECIDGLYYSFGERARLSLQEIDRININQHTWTISFTRTDNKAISATGGSGGNGSSGRVEEKLDEKTKTQLQATDAVLATDAL